jgi:transposase
VISDIKKATLRGVVLSNVESGSIVSADELISHGLLEGDGYKHGTVKHGQKEWSYYCHRHDAVHNTNRVESFWKLFEKSFASTRVHISAKHANRYLSEFAFRTNDRVMANAMFDLLIASL